MLIPADLGEAQNPIPQGVTPTQLVAILFLRDDQSVPVSLVKVWVCCYGLLTSMMINPELQL